MNVIGHEAIGVNVNAIPARLLTPQIKIRQEIVRLSKTALTVITTLDEVVGHPGQVIPFS